MKHSSDRWMKLYSKFVKDVPSEIILFENLKENMHHELLKGMVLLLYECYNDYKHVLLFENCMMNFI